jgi:agmatinase
MAVCGAATFLGLPYRPELIAVPDFGGLDVAVVGVPMDLGVTNRAGARLGPRAVRAVERIGPYEHALGIAPSLHLKAADVGDVPMKSRFDLEQCHADIEAFFATVRAAGVIPLAVGGDHSITLPILRALGKEKPVGMVHIDAHCDTGGTFEGPSFITAVRSAMRCSTECWTRNARSRSAFTAAPSICGSSPSTAA